MKSAAHGIKAQLMSIIREMATKPELFVKNPYKDFTRKRKLGFEQMLILLLAMGGGSLKTELLKCHGYSTDTVTTSAFIQQRDKLLSVALEYILHAFAPSPADIKRYRGYRLLAVDGSNLHTPTNPAEPENYSQNHPGEKGYNLMHLNALYDLSSQVYIDAVLQNRRCENEHQALTSMVDRSSIHEGAILIADRGYESYNNLAHIERKGWKYLIRIRDSASIGILSGLKIPNSLDFDVEIQRVLTRKQTNEVMAKPEVYRFMPMNSNFDFLDRQENRFYQISFRIVRFKISNDAYETVITNLDPNEFPPSELKNLYRMRWGIETAFRSLKHVVGLIRFHSKKAECIAQEVFAALIMYNFSERIASHAVIQQKNSRYEYQINFSFAVRICKHFFSSCDIRPPDVEALILANLLPIRNDRCFPRNIRSRQAVGFNYRLA